MMNKAHSNMIELINLLNDGEYHDGTTLGEKLNITRAAVWKIIKKLQNYQVPIESIQGKGYQLTSPWILLDSKKITANLSTKKIQVDVFEKIDSTSTYLLNNYSGSQPAACIAETQTTGKGRFSRTWHSPFGQNIYLSLTYPIHKDLSELSGLSLIIGLALCNAIENCTALAEPLYVKWPNDIIINNKKMAGILVDIQAEAHGLCHVIIGTGINVNMLQATKAQIPKPWTSLQLISGQYQDRNLLSAHIINSIFDYLTRFMQYGLDHFKQEWQQRDGLLNQQIRLTVNKQEIIGTAIGINHHGHLMLTLGDNTQQSFASGDASILG